MQASVKFAEWELVELIGALRVAAEDGQYDDEPQKADQINRLQSKLKRALRNVK